MIVVRNKEEPKIASRERAIVNNLNERARFYGQTDMLTIEDVRAVLHWFDYKSCKSGEPATSLDHMKPLALGGENKKSNLQVLTVNENKAKGDQEIDYRAGRICPDDFTAPNAQEKTQNKRRNKVDWNALRLEYVSGNMSLRDLADREGIPERTLFYQSSEIGDWNEQRIEFRSKVAALSQQAIAEKEVNARSLSFDLGVEIVNDWRRNIKRNTSAAEVAQILKVLLALQGQAGERIEHVESGASDTELFHRLTQAFDTGEEDRGYSPLGDSGEDAGAGWSD